MHPVYIDDDLLIAITRHCIVRQAERKQQEQYCKEQHQILHAPNSCSLVEHLQYKKNIVCQSVSR